MKRRNFIKAAGAAASVPMILNGMKLSAMPNSSLASLINNDSDKVLVLIQLNGGNDGINMVIPRDKYDTLAIVRSNILLPENSILELTDTVGLHPVMQGVQNMYKDGQVSILQSVGYPNQNRSHFRSMDIWSSGSPADEVWNEGWLGRYFDTLHPTFPTDYPNSDFPDPFAITMGNVVSETCQGVGANFSLTLSDPFSLAPLTEGEPGEIPDTPYGDELSFLRVTIKQANKYGERITAVAQVGKNQVPYPENNGLGEQLKNVALLISGGLKTKIYIVNIGGFDTHANQVVEGDPTTGEHAALMETLSEAMTAFQKDLDAQGLSERVVGMTFSEFGRRIKSNDSFGTDHGTASPMIVFGSCVNPTVFGDSPDIPADVDNSEGLPMQNDFRDIYGSLLMDWFEVKENDVKTLLHPDFQYIPIIQSCSVTSTRPVLTNDQPIALFNYPNPFRSWTTISFKSENEWAKLSIFNAMGAELKVLLNQRLQAGEHEVRFDAGNLPPGSYYYRLQLKGRQKTSRMVKM
ncbi:MAG: DUF1501 domain-containing protein [Saprospiraceae bacterium]